MYEKKQLIKNFKSNELVNDIFVIKFKKPVEQYKNGFRFEIRVGDSSKEIMVKYWGPNNEAEVQKLYDSIKKDNVIFVSGKINEWNDQLEISTKSIKPLKLDEYDASAFVRKSKYNIDEIWNNLFEFIEGIKNEELKKLINHFFKDETFIKQFQICPAAMYIHHGWIGGLMEHTLSICKIVERFCEIQPSLDKDLVITGVLFHDMGKLREFETTTNIHMTTEGMLIGHVSIAIEELSNVMNKLKTPKELKWKILHMIITHMGEYGSNKTPAFPEAMALYLADQADSQLMHMIDIKENATTEDDYVYVKSLGNVYLK